MRDIKVCSLVLLAGILFSGCERSASTVNPPVPPAPPGTTIAHIHWLGKKRIAAETNSAGFMRIWNEPESAKLQAQTLDKLSTAPWRLLPRVASTNTAAARSLRPLLDDVVGEESYLEVRQGTNAAELAFAIHLNAARAGAWETNLAAALESLTGIRPVPSSASWHGWSLRKHHPPNLLELVRVGEWTLLGAGQEHNGLLVDLVARIQRDHAPFPASGTNFWLEAHFDLGRVAGAWSSNRIFGAGFPGILLTVASDGTNVRSRGDLTFPDRLPLALDPWIVPTNLVQEPLISVVASRGVAPWLRKLKLLSGLLSNSVPNQIYLWDRGGTLFQTYFALPVPDSTAALKAVAPAVTNWLITILGTNNGYATPETNLDGFVWQALPFAFPFLHAQTNSGQFLYGGLFPTPIDPRRAMPAELAQHIIEGTNLVLFEWEKTGQKLVHWRYLDDVVRMLLDERGPRLQGDLASLQWLARNWTNLPICVTEVRLVDSNRLTFVRKSSVGFNGLELDLLANWLETPVFPGGLQSLLITNNLPLGLKRNLLRNRPPANSAQGLKPPGP